MSNLFIIEEEKNRILYILSKKYAPNDEEMKSYRTALALVERVKPQHSFEILKGFLTHEEYNTFLETYQKVIPNGLPGNQRFHN